MKSAELEHVHTNTNTILAPLSSIFTNSGVFSRDLQNKKFSCINKNVFGSNSGDLRAFKILNKQRYGKNLIVCNGLTNRYCICYACE